MAVVTTGQYIDYTTMDGDRWDNISYAMYGSISLMDTIIQANPNLAITDVLPGGLKINIPIVDNTQLATQAETLPPWKTQ